MNKSIYTLLCFLFFMGKVVAQENYMEGIVREACACLEGISEEVTGEALEMQMGICILNAASPHQKEILAEYGLDLNRMDQEGEKIGVLIGGKMAAECPNVLVAVTQRNSSDTTSGDVQTLTAQGTVVDVVTDFLIYFSVKNEKGRTEKFYWYSYVESETDLIREYTQLKDKKVRLEYHKEEFFDPKIMEYRPLNIIDALSINETRQ